MKEYYYCERKYASGIALIVLMLLLCSCFDYTNALAVSVYLSQIFFIFILMI